MKRATVFLSTTAVVLAAAATAGAAALPPVPPLPDPLPALLAPAAPPSQASPQSAAAASAPAQAESVTTAQVAAQQERLIAAEINVVRRSHGLARLTLSRQLTRAGEEHARQLALGGFFSHNWADGTPFGTWIRSFYPVAGAKSWSAAENLAWSVQSVTAHQAVELWLASPTHRHILLDKRWRQIGLGVIRADGAGGVYGGQNVSILAAEFGVRR